MEVKRSKGEEVPCVTPLIREKRLLCISLLARNVSVGSVWSLGSILALNLRCRPLDERSPDFLRLSELLSFELEPPNDYSNSNVTCP